MGSWQTSVSMTANNLPPGCSICSHLVIKRPNDQGKVVRVSCIAVVEDKGSSQRLEVGVDGQLKAEEGGPLCCLIRPAGGALGGSLASHVIASGNVSRPRKELVR